MMAMIGMNNYLKHYEVWRQHMTDNPQGWICPNCKKVYSPDVKSCKKCSKNEAKSETTEQFLQE